MRKTILALAMVMIAAFVAFGNIPRPTNSPTPKPPKQEKSIETDLHIRLIDGDTAKIKIPKSSISKLRAELEDLENGTDNTAAAASTDGGGFGNFQTIVSAAFLSVGLVLGGLWFARSRSSRAVKTTVAGALLFASGIATTVVVANIGPPLGTRGITSELFSQPVQSYGTASGRVKMVVVDDKNSDAITLEVPRQKAQ